LKRIFNHFKSWSYLFLSGWWVTKSFEIIKVPKLCIPRGWSAPRALKAWNCCFCSFFSPGTAFRMGHQFLPFFYVKSWSNLTPNGSFKICSSWRFENTPYMLNLMKFWLRYLGLKTIYIFQKLISFHLFDCQLSPIFLHQIQRSGTDFQSACHEDSKTDIEYWNW